MNNNFTPFAKRLWEAIPANTKALLLENVYCGHCSGVTTIINYSGRVVKGDLLLEGECKTCMGKVARIIESE